MNTPQYKIVLAGTGNVALQLGLALKEAKHTIVQVYGRQKSAAAGLAGMLQCGFTSSLEKINTAADIYIIAVNDDAIAAVVKQLKLSNQIVVHTSGSAAMDVLKPSSKNYGVFYPLQTFSKNNKADFKSIPICLEANNAAVLKILQILAGSISNNVQKINSEQRKTIHLAAVFACNFSNHLYAVAASILAADKLSLDILKPLIDETAKKIKNHSPAEMQTGPAIRGDKKTMDKHLKMLSGQKEYRQLYKLMSKSISASRKENK